MARGFLLKQSSKGEWQARFYQLRGSFLMYWASEKKSLRVKNPDSAIDIRLIASAEVFQFLKFESSGSSRVLEEPALKLTSLSGREIVLRARSVVDRKNISEWQKRISVHVDTLIPDVADEVPTQESSEGADGDNGKECRRGEEEEAEERERGEACSDGDGGCRDQEEEEESD
jgi:hypothetical protein